jgi:phosphoribosylformimino-5-aminoimidazole carboxamide ribotide isomerase
MILFPAIDLKDGQCVRLKLGDMEQATVFNDDPGRAGRKPSRTRVSSGCTWSTSTAPLQGKPSMALPSMRSWPRRRTRCSSAAASAHGDHIESWLSRRAVAGDPRHGRRARSGTGNRGLQEISGPCRRRHRCQGRQGGCRGMGRDVRARDYRAGRSSKAPALRRSSTPISPATAFWLGSTGIRRWSLPAPFRFRSSPRVAWPRWPISKRMLQPDARKLEGAISGRALYDGRIDPTEALALIKAARAKEIAQ